MGRVVKLLLPLLLMLVLAFAGASPTRQAATTPLGLANMSLRTEVPAGGQTLAGFVLDTDGTLLIRAAGPGLAGFGVTGAMQNPTLRLVRADGVVLFENDDWLAADAATMTRVGAFPFQPGSRDAALVVRLFAGAYTCVVTDSAVSTNRQGREVLIEVYNAATN